MSDTILGYPLPLKKESNKFGNIVIADKTFNVHCTLSNSLSIFEEYYKKTFFPHDYFRTVWKNTQHEFRTKVRAIRGIKNKPILFINTDIELDTESFQSTKYMPSHQIYDTNQNSFLGSYSIPLLTINDLSISFNSNYYYSDFELLIVESSYRKMLNTYNHLVHTRRMGQNAKYTIERKIKSEIPRIYIKHIARTEGLDVKSDQFLDLLNSHSNHPITRIDRVNGNYDFYANLIIDIQVDSSQIPSKENFNRDQELEDAHRVTDIMRFRYPIPVKYFLTSSSTITEIVANQLKESFNETETIEPVTVEEPYFISEYKETEPSPDKYPGFILARTLQVQFDNVDEYLDYFTLVDYEEWIKNAIKAVYPNDVGLESGLKVDIYANGTILDEGISSTKLKPSIFDPEITYDFHIYINMGDVNDYLNDLKLD